MNNTVYYDPPFSDDRRRQLLFERQLLVYSPRKSTLAFIAFARKLIEEAFAPLDPETAQHQLSVEQYADILLKLKPGFIHHPESKRLIQDMFVKMGCDLEKTYFDVPKMRSSTSDNYLMTGIAYAWHPHRDTWYSAPSCQVNWWIPIYDIQSDNAMAFHPQYWNRPVKNSSKGYNYYLWNQQNRGEHVAKFLKEDPRPFPRERLINSCLHEELCSWVDQPGPFGGNPLVRECLFWGVARCQAARAPVRPRPLGCRQQAPPRHI